MTKRKELILYCLMIITTTLYFFLNAPDTFFNIPPALIFDSYWYPYINFAILLGLMSLYLLFLKEVFSETSKRKEVAIIFKYTLISIPLFYVSFAVCVYKEYSNDMIFYASHLINGPFCGLLIYYNWKTKGNIRLIIYGLMVTFVSVVATMLMTIRYNQGHFAHYIDKYPLLYIRIGMFIDILLFQVFLMRHWVSQEKELATQEIKNQLAIAQFKNNVNHALHDDIGTNLSKINLRSYMALQKFHDPEYNVKNVLHSIQAEAQSMIEKIKNILSEEHNFNGLPWNEEIYQFAREMCESKNIKLVSNYLAVKTLELTSIQKYQLVLLMKEAINNAVKYSGCTELQLSIKLDSKNITFHVSDNGIGFDVSKPSFGNGLKNMKARANKINGEFQIISENNSGSQIKVTLKI